MSNDQSQLIFGSVSVIQARDAVPLSVVTAVFLSGMFRLHIDQIELDAGCGFSALRVLVYSLIRLCILYATSFFFPLLCQDSEVAIPSSAHICNMLVICLISKHEVHM
jgi:hypothetical protein